MKRQPAHIVLSALLFGVLTLTGCHNPPMPESTPEVSAPAPSPDTQVPEGDLESNARRTGEAVGRELREFWALTKEFSKGVWSEVTSDQ